MFNPWVGKISWRRKWRNLVGYSPRGHKESDTTEKLHFSDPFLEDILELVQDVHVYVCVCVCVCILIITTHTLRTMELIL